ncbi:MAG TPA: flavin reductase family protein [Rhodothermia bacterium]|nr:flavin reductase family protein [Rhodothermia bacterium]
MPTVTDDDLRSVMRRVPAAVTVVTARAGSEHRGMTVGSFASVSMDPLLVSFNVGKSSGMHGVLMDAQNFCMHLLSEQQADISNLFANPDFTGAQQFERVAHTVDLDGTPILTETLAYIRCEKIAVYDAGDHCLLLGRVDQIVHQRDGQPLIYYDRSYRTVGGEVHVPEIAETPTRD